MQAKTHSNLSAPKFTPSDLTPVGSNSLVTEASLQEVHLEDVDAAGIRARNLVIDEALFERVGLTESKLEKLSMTDVKLRGCDLSAASCTESTLIRASFSKGRLTGTDFSRSVIRDVTFDGCKLDLANFRYAKLTRVRFVNCTLNETDFQAAELTDVTLDACHLERTEFGQSKIKATDARGSQLIDIRGWRWLSGLKLDSLQLTSVAPQLAAELGLKIED